ncbi:MAG: type II secretion system protein [Vampirovibrionales bacterium]|nr:type II secretion system protein [Vampirovibrionales bacterium]
MKHLFLAKKGFTLAELLIALAILGVIATFTIPKVLNSSQSSQNTAIAKEVAGMISGAFAAYQVENSITTDTPVSVLTNSMNYVSLVTTAGGGSAEFDCTALNCLRLHSGATLGYEAAQEWDATANYVNFSIDPDGAGTGAPAGTFVLYFNGRLTTGQNATGLAGAAGPALELNGPGGTTDPAYMEF